MKPLSAVCMAPTVAAPLQSESNPSVSMRGRRSVIPVVPVQGGGWGVTGVATLRCPGGKKGGSDEEARMKDDR